MTFEEISYAIGILLPQFAEMFSHLLCGFILSVE